MTIVVTLIAVLWLWLVLWLHRIAPPPKKPPPYPERMVGPYGRYWLIDGVWTHVPR